ITIAETVERSRQDILFDPQTSGGLLISASVHQADDLVETLKDAGIAESGICRFWQGAYVKKIQASFCIK
ncbi:MAG: hypothetical protein U9Q05_14170, partial [Thermodesulfobacteriota bacterium]|nr:hypothetical protein [Thermodesulfobacteriota bacterium]